jgi:hypothetical protein
MECRQPGWVDGEGYLTSTTGTSSEANRSRGEGEQGRTCVGERTLSRITSHLPDHRSHIACPNAKQSRTTPHVTCVIGSQINMEWAEGTRGRSSGDDRSWVEKVFKVKPKVIYSILDQK